MHIYTFKQSNLGTAQLNHKHWSRPAAFWSQDKTCTIVSSYHLLFVAAALHPGPPDGSDHQDPAVREEGRRHVFPDDLLLPDVLDALRCRVHDRGLRQEEHGLSHGGHHPLVLCQVQHSLQPPHLRVHEQKGSSQSSVNNWCENCSKELFYVCGEELSILGQL